MIYFDSDMSKSTNTVGLSTQKRKTIMSEQASSQPPNRKIYGSLDNFPVEMIYKFAYMNMQFGFS
jgi:hypothetical protein